MKARGIDHLPNSEIMRMQQLMQARICYFFPLIDPAETIGRRRPNR